jgi:hypothetical protein
MRARRPKQKPSIDAKVAEEALARVQENAAVLGSVESLSGTTWSGISNSKAVEFTFYADHTLSWTHGVWSQNGNTVHIEMNDFAEYDGEIDGDHMKGTAKNKNGYSWTGSLTKQW